MIPFNLYPILDLDTCRKRNIEPDSLTGRWRDRGISFYQIRAKDISEERYLDLALSLKKKSPEMNIIANDFLVSALDRPDVFSGIHLGQEDFASLSEKSLLRLAAKSLEGEFLAGISTHNELQIDQALSDVMESRGENKRNAVRWDYLAIGPVAQTLSKPGGIDPVISEGKRKAIFQKITLAFEIFKEKSLPTPGVVLIGGLTPDIYRRICNDIVKINFIPIPAVISSAVDVKSLEVWMRITE